jgi:hypothetical protein
VPLHNNKALETFGPIPFDIVYARNGVFRRITELSEDLSSSTLSDGRDQRQTNPVPQAELQKVVDFFGQGPDEVVDTATSWMNEIDGAPPENEPDGVDVTNVTDDNAVLQEALDHLNDPEFSTWSLEIKSRVIMDLWHAMARIKVAKEHGMRRLFGIAL